MLDIKGFEGTLYDVIANYSTNADDILIDAVSITINDIEYILFINIINDCIYLDLFCSNIIVDSFSQYDRESNINLFYHQCHCDKCKKNIYVCDINDNINDYSLSDVYNSVIEKINEIH